MSYELFLLDALELTLREDYADSLDDAALSAMVVSTAEFLAHTSHD
jgi:hypothetical protein